MPTIHNLNEPQQGVALDIEEHPSHNPHAKAQADYQLVRHLLAYITENWREQPSLEHLAAQAGYSPEHVQRLFTRWAGLSPKAFLQAVTIEHARSILAVTPSLLEASFELGLSSPGRLHDLFIKFEGVSPGIFKLKGLGLTFSYGFHPCPFGLCLIMTVGGTLAGLAFADPGEQQKALSDMMSRWPQALYVENPALTAPLVPRIFERDQWQPDNPLRITFIGTDFEIRVWESLLHIPLGKATTYAAIAQHIGRPKANRAVGTAVGKNPLAFVVPCHRVLGKAGNLCGYHWGLTRKRALIGWEAGQLQRG